MMGGICLNIESRF